MSVLPSQTNITPVDTRFLENNRDVTLISSMNLYNGNLNISQINLDSIQMDCAIINGFPTLLLNNQPVAGVSSLTSSVTSWASYPALNTINYAGAGGTANLNNVNALTSLSSATVTSGAVNTNTLSTASIVVSTINGVPFPVSQTSVLNVTGSQIVSGINTTNVDFAALNSGFYLVVVLISTGGTDPFSCSTTVRYSSGVTVGGCLHAPFLSGAVPSFNNCVSIQDNNAGGSIISVVINTNSVVAIGAVPQISVYRLT
jgi:hypothetical protein